MAAARAAWQDVIAFAGVPERAPAFRAFGIEALAVATDLALLRLGADRALGND